MGSNRRRSRRFLCFGIAAGAVDGDDDDDDHEALQCKNNPAADGREPKLRRRRRLFRRVVSRFLKSVSPMQGSRRVPKASSQDSSLEGKSLAEKKTLIGDDDESASEPLFSSSASSSSLSTASSSCSSSSSPTSSLPSSASTSPGQPSSLIVRRKRVPARKLAQAQRPTSVLCLLLVSLVVTVFCGRTCAILWASAWLCLAHCRSLSGGGRLPECDEAAAAGRGVREEAGGV